MKPFVRCEKRGQRRVRKCGPVRWRCLGLTPWSTGWVLEGSETSAAFVWRGLMLPAAGTLLEICDEGEGAERARRAIVRRSARLHDDLGLVAAEFIQTRPFPPAAHHHAEVALKPVVRVPRRRPMRPSEVSGQGENLRPPAGIGAMGRLAHAFKGPPRPR